MPACTQSINSKSHTHTQRQQRATCTLHCLKVHLYIAGCDNCNAAINASMLGSSNQSAVVQCCPKHATSARTQRHSWIPPVRYLQVSNGTHQQQTHLLCKQTLQETAAGRLFDRA